MISEEDIDGDNAADVKRHASASPPDESSNKRQRYSGLDRNKEDMGRFSQASFCGGGFNAGINAMSVSNFASLRSNGKLC
jgi:hypothetical protein